MFKKVMSLALASTLVLSVGAFAASAAEAEDAVAANDESAVAADDSSAVAAGDESQVGAGTKIYFDVKSAGWKTLARSIATSGELTVQVNGQAGRQRKKCAKRKATIFILMI